MIFISHNETDAPLAQALVEFLRDSLDVPPAKIRCTSVPGFQLPFGKTISGQLKSDIGASNAVLVLITRASLQSRWVVFELGAAWALGKVIVPILGPGLSQSDLPGPMAEYPVVRSDDPNATARLRDAVAQIAQELAFAERGGGGPQNRLESFIGALRKWSPVVPPETANAVAFQLSWLLTLLLMKQTPNSSAVEAQIEAYAAELDVVLPPTWRHDLQASNSGKAFNGLLGTLGGQLVANKPKLTPYFEAGLNLIMAASKSDRAALAAIATKLDLPTQLREPGEDALAWLNRVHDHFETVLRERTG